jgi:hypothetical protein
VIVQSPAAQAPLPFAGAQMLPQAPQFRASWAKSF